MGSREHAERFLTCLTGDVSTPVTFQTFDDTEAKRQELAQVRNSTLDAAWNWICDMNARGAGVFVTINETDLRGRKVENIQKLRALFVDFDETAMEPAFKPSMIVNSLRGQHYYWLLDGDDDLSRFTPAQEQLAKFYNSDPKIKDLPRVMRLPGTRNQKRWDGDPTHGAPVTVTLVDEARTTYTVGEILGHHPIKRTGSRNLALLVDDPDAPIPAGGRDNKMFQIACDFRRKDGMDEKQIYDALMEVNLRRCQPPLLDSDIRRLAMQGAKKPKGDQSPEQKAAQARVMSDMGNAQYFVGLFGNVLRYTAETRAWWVWSERGVWQRDYTGQVERYAKEFVNVLIKDALAEEDADKKAALMKHAAHTQHAQRIKAIVDLARSEDAVAVRPEVFDRDPWMINCQNGIMDLRTGELRDHDRTQLMTKMVNARYDPQAKCPTFDAFMEKVLPDDEVRLYVMRALGSCLVGEQRDQIVFMPFGTGKNGKSVLMALMSSLLDGYCKTAPRSTFIQNKNDAGNGNDVATLIGARFVFATESGEAKALNEEQIKQLTGGDKISARMLYQDFTEYKPGFKLWFAVNHRPVIKSVGFAIWRRIHLVPFTVTISDADQIPRDVLDKNLMAEADGIFTKLVRACLIWQRDGLNPPDAVTKAVEEYQAEEDPLAEWTETCTVTRDGLTWSKTAAYNAYRQFAEAQGERPLGKKMFGVKMSDKGYQSVREGHSGVRAWAGIGPSSNAPEFSSGPGGFEDGQDD